MTLSILCISLLVPLGAEKEPESVNSTDELQIEVDEISAMDLPSLVNLDLDPNPNNCSFDDSRAVDQRLNGFIVNVGYTSCNDFPTGNLTSTLTGMFDAYISLFTPNGALIWSQYLGGTSNDFALDVIFDANNNIYVVGLTNSTDFPVLHGLTVNL